MNELIITIMLVIPAPHKMVDWTINEVPTQIQLIHEDGTEVSYNATAVPCDYKPRSTNEMVFVSPQAYTEDNRCYSIFDLSSPRFIRHPNYWHGVKNVLD
jgi:hypothetical protein